MKKPERRKRGRPAIKTDQRVLIRAVQHVEDVLLYIREGHAPSLELVSHNLVADALESLGLPLNGTAYLVDALAKIKKPDGSHGVAAWIKSKGVREAAIALVGKIDGFPAEATIRRRFREINFNKKKIEEHAKKVDRAVLQHEIASASPDEMTILYVTKEEAEGIELPAHVRLVTQADYDAEAETNAAESRARRAEARRGTQQWLAQAAQRRAIAVADVRSRLGDFPPTDTHVLWIFSDELGDVKLPPNVRLVDDAVLEMPASWTPCAQVPPTSVLTPSAWFAERLRRRSRDF